MFPSEKEMRGLVLHSWPTAVSYLLFLLNFTRINRVAGVASGLHYVPTDYPLSTVPGGTMQDCLPVMRRLADFLKGTLPETEVIRVRAHIARCGDCRMVLDSARQTLQNHFHMGPERRRSAA